MILSRRCLDLRVSESRCRGVYSQLPSRQGVRFLGAPSDLEALHAAGGWGGSSYRTQRWPAGRCLRGPSVRPARDPPVPIGRSYGFLPFPTVAHQSARAFKPASPARLFRQSFPGNRERLPCGPYSLLSGVLARLDHPHCPDRVDQHRT